MTGNPANGVVMEIACDESGSDGENLTGGNTDVFAHASVRLPQETAAEYVREIRRRIRSPAEEYKANHLLREKHRAVLESFLGPAGPLRDGNAHVHLTEKTYFVVDRAVDLLLDGAGEGTEAATLFREGPRTFGERGWRDFLTASNQLLRVRNDGAPTVPADVFFRTVDALRDTYPDTAAGVIVGRLAAARSRAESYRERMRDSPVLFPVLNPLLPAIVGTARYWIADGRGVRLVHDRQNMLTPERIAWIMDAAPLTDVVLVAARSDARVQLADFLAGIARKLASDELNGHGDPVLTALLRPYLGPDSVWGDAASGLRLGTAGANSAVQRAC
ncbi:hypothetical protein [Streptomyces sp. NPDC096013]|uniref:hypothetical protein n=1 Tax=Streptomyces sp. NPDC096013 TaxID=3366069 RepID=UPI0037FD7D35